MKKVDAFELKERIEGVLQDMFEEGLGNGSKDIRNSDAFLFTMKVMQMVFRFHWENADDTFKKIEEMTNALKEKDFDMIKVAEYLGSHASNPEIPVLLKDLYEKEWEIGKVNRD